MMAAARQSGATITRSYTHTKAVVSTLMHESFVVVATKLSGSDRDVARAGLHDAAEAIGEHLQTKALADAQELAARASRHQSTLINEAGDLFDDEHAAKVDELAGTIAASGEQQAHKIEQQLDQQLHELATAEAQYLARLNRLKAGTAVVIDQATRTAQQISARAGVEVANARLARGAAIAGLATVSRSAVEQLHARAPGPDREAIEQRVAQELAKLATGMIEQASASRGVVDGISDDFRATADQWIAKATGLLDPAQARLSKQLADVATGLLGRCAAQRGVVQAAYTNTFVESRLPRIVRDVCRSCDASDRSRRCVRSSGSPPQVRMTQRHTRLNPRSMNRTSRQSSMKSKMSPTW